MKIADIEVSLIDYMGNDDSIVNSARVSFHKRPDNYTSEQNEKLIMYLAKHQHKSPFNHAFLSFRVKAPIFVARQLVKHKFLPWNEVSRRYVDEEPEFYFPEYWRAKADNVKQGSAEREVDLFAEDVMFDSFYLPDHVTQLSLRTYEKLLESGVCAEQARMVLPQNTMTEWVWSGSLGAFCDMLKLRLDPHTQKETQEVAIKIAKCIQNYFPVSYKALLEQ